MSPDIASVHPPLSSSRSMGFERAGSKDTDESITREIVERVSTSFPIYEYTKLKWKEVNDAFASTFGEDLEDFQVYVNIHKSILYNIACKYPMFPCAYMIHCIISHTDRDTMTLSNVRGIGIATFRAQDDENMYHMLKLVITMETPFIIPNNNANSRVL